MLGRIKKEKAMKSLIKKISTLALFGLIISSPVFAKDNMQIPVLVSNKSIEKPVASYKNISVNFPASGSYKIYGQSIALHASNESPALSIVSKGDAGYSLCINCPDYQYIVESADSNFKVSHNCTDFKNATTWTINADTIA